MTRQRRRIHTATLWALLLLPVLPLFAGCASTSTAPHEFLDQNTGSTLVIVQAPIVFARARTDVAANARDYATLVTVLEDRSGKYQLWLIAHRWSTVDPRFGGPLADREPQLQLVADDRTLSLDPTLPAPTLLAHRDQLFTPSGAQSSAYAVDADLLRYIASTRLLSLQFRDDPSESVYGLWHDERPAMQALLKQVLAQ
jgi:hypothetical protein